MKVHRRSDRNPSVDRRSLELMRSAINLLTAAMPEADPELIGGIFANILDLWETGQKLDRGLQKLSKLQLPRDCAQVRNILLWIEAIQLDMGAYWIREVKKDLPKLLRALDRLERQSTQGRKVTQRANPGPAVPDLRHRK